MVAGGNVMFVVEYDRDKKELWKVATKGRAIQRSAILIVRPLRRLVAGGSPNFFCIHTECGRPSWSTRLNEARRAPGSFQQSVSSRQTMNVLNSFAKADSRGPRRTHRLVHEQPDDAAARWLLTELLLFSGEFQTAREQMRFCPGKRPEWMTF